jgi:hypothetical protein
MLALTPDCGKGQLVLESEVELFNSTRTTLSEAQTRGCGPGGYEGLDQRRQWYFVSGTGSHVSAIKVVIISKFRNELLIRDA